MMDKLGSDNFMIHARDTTIDENKETLHIRLDCFGDRKGDGHYIVLGTLADGGHIFLTPEEAFEAAEALIELGEMLDDREQQND